MIGLGNTLRGDDALGRIAAERVRRRVDPQEVKVIDQCAPTPELCADLSLVSRVIFLDASADGPIGHLVTRRLKPREAAASMVHHMDLDGLLGMTRHLYGDSPTGFAVTFRGRSFALNDCHLTPEVEAACDLLVNEALRLLDSLP